MLPLWPLWTPSLPAPASGADPAESGLLLLLLHEDDDAEEEEEEALDEEESYTL